MTDMRIGGVYVDMGLNTAQFQKGVQRAKEEASGLGASLRRSLGGITREFNVGLGRSLLGGLAAGLSVQGAQKLIDSATRINNALKVAGLSGDELTKVYERLFASAQKNGAPLETLVTLYSRAAQQQKELGVSSEQLLKFTDDVALALRVAGTDANTASGALLQLGQALGSGTVHAEEFNSILEGVPTIAQTAAAGIKEAGGSVAKLKQLVVDGKLSSKAFFDGFAAGAETLASRAAGAETTISAGFVRLQNVLVDVATRFDDSTHASRTLANMIDNTLIPAIQELGGIFTGITNGPIGQFYDWLGKTIDRVVQLSADLGALSGLDKIGGNPYIGQGRIQDRIDAAFSGTAAPKGNRKPTEITVDKGTPVKPITLADYTVPASGKGKGSRGAKDRADDYERLTQRIVDSTAATVAETEAQRQINPLVDDFGFAVEKARAQQELLTAAQKAGTEITPELRGQISALAEQYALATVEAAKLAESQDAARQKAEDMRDLGKDVMGGFIHDLVDGKSAADALADALGKIGDKLLDLALNSLFDKGGIFSGGGGLGGGGGGLLGGAIIPGILHSGGVAGSDGYGHGRSFSPGVFAGAPRYHSGGIAGLKPNEIPAILQRGEMIIPKGAPRMPSLQHGGSGQSVVVNFNPVIDNRGASSEAVAKTAFELQKLKAELPARVVAAVRDANKRIVKLR